MDHPTLPPSAAALCLHITPGTFLPRALQILEILSGTNQHLSGRRWQRVRLDSIPHWFIPKTVGSGSARQSLVNWTVKGFVRDTILKASGDPSSSGGEHPPLPPALASFSSQIVSFQEPPGITADAGLNYASSFHDTPKCISSNSTLQSFLFPVPSG